jgi:23S rRNA pseudouridine2605 synthase
LLPEKFQNYFYIGRLDKDSRGLLLMTNDSSLVNEYEHPSKKIEKEYIVQIDRQFSSNDYLKIKK